MLNFVYPATFNFGFLVTNENTSIAFAEMVAYIENLNPNTVLNRDVTITSTGSFTTVLIDVEAPSQPASSIDNSAYSITFDIYANSTMTPVEAAGTYVWTFSDVNGTCTASFAIPVLTLQGTPGQIGDGSNGSQLIYQSNLTTTQYLYGTATTPSYQAVFVGNSVTLNVIGCLPSQEVIIYSYDASSGSEVYTNSVTDATGAITYTVTVPAGSDAYEFFVQGSYSFNNTPATNFFSFSNYPILFDQTTIVANADLFTGYAFTTEDTSTGSYVPATVSLYLDGAFLGNTITSNTGVWTFAPPPLTVGTYAITAAAIPQMEPAGGLFTWPYSNASANLVVTPSDILTLQSGNGGQGASGIVIIEW